MPLRPHTLLLRRPAILPEPCNLAGRRALTASPALRRRDLSSRNHYERLNVHHDASPGDIKKSFYKLSKAHHPDTNPNDPSASQTFSLISESYTILSDPPRRAAYDRDVLRLYQHQPHGHHQQPKGSYHSAGGRPPSGLSRRRTTFRGPPPSFYRSGGWGAHADKRQRAHEESTAGAGSGSGNRHGGGDEPDHAHHQQPHQRYGGMGPGDDPFGHHDDVPHFNRDGHHRTQQREDDRRWQREHRARRAVDEDNVEFEPQVSIGAHFMVVMTIVAASFIVPALYLRYGRSGKRKENRVQGS